MAQDYLQSVSEVYAQAIFELAKESSLLEQVGEDLAGISQCIDADKEFAEFLATPSVSVDEKNKVLDRLFGGKVEALTLDLLKVLTTRERLEAIRQISKEYNTLLDFRVGRAYGTITTAVELSADDFEALRKSICENLGKELILDCKVDPDIIAGMKLKIGNSILDGSVRNILSQIAEKMRTQILPDITLMVEDTGNIDS